MIENWNRTKSRAAFGALLAGAVLVVAAFVAAASTSIRPVQASVSQICPSVGSDTATATGQGCNFIVTVAANGSVSTQGNLQPGYDGGDNYDDTLIGIVNNSAYSIGSIVISSSDGTPLFKFDGDGVCTYYGIPAGDESALSYCSTSQLSGVNDTVTGDDYQGPINTFTNVNSTFTSATLQFSGFGPNSTTFFSAEAPSTAQISASRPSLLGLGVSLVTPSAQSPSLVYGGTGSYDLVVTNYGSATSGATTVIESLPAGEKFLSGGGAGSGFTCSAYLQTVTCTSASAIETGVPAVIPVDFSLSEVAVAGDTLQTSASVDGGPQVTSSSVVLPALVDLGASFGSMTYGGPIPVVTATGGTGFVFGQTTSVFTHFPVCSTSATTSSPVGTYSTSCSGATASNYSFTYSPGTMTVTKRAITVTASSQRVAFGHVLAPVTPVYSLDFANGDTGAVVTGMNCSTSATTGSPVGTYPTSCSGATATNYSFSYVAGQVVITKVHQIAIAAGKSTNTVPTTTTVPVPTTTTVPVPTTTTVPVPTTTTVPRPTTTVPLSAPLFKVSFCGPPGTKIAGCTVTVQGGGLKPYSPVVIDVHSTPVELGSTKAGADGSYRLAVTLPGDLQPGGHHLVANETSATSGAVRLDEPFTVTVDGLLGVIGSIPPGPFATYLPLAPASHEALVLATTIGGVVAIGAASAALGGGGLGAASGSGSGELISEGLVDVEIEREESREEIRRREGAKGDRSITWRAPGHQFLNHFSKHHPARVAKYSPVIARVIIDGDYLRAMFGSIWLLACATSLALGVYASSTTSWYGVPPPLGLFLAILGLSIFDATLGYIAGLVFVGCSVAAGHITNAAEVREACGLILVWFAVPLAAAAIRPLRRAIHLKIDSVWERLADVVIAGLFAAWVTQKMLNALSVLVGAELPISKHVAVVGFAVFGFIAVRIGLESIATMHYPARLEAVSHEGELEPEPWHAPLSLMIQVAVFVFVAAAFVGAAWALVIGAVVFFAPAVSDIFSDRFAKSDHVTKWTPRALLKWFIILAIGASLNLTLKHTVHNNTLAEDIGFIVLPLPMVVFWFLELFKKDEEESERLAVIEKYKWVYRFSGLALVVLSTALVVTHLVA